jgi:hypothetical protein
MITLPAGLAMSAESLAKREGRTVEELVEEAVLAYSRQRSEAFWAEIAEYAAAHNPKGYTEEDIPRLIKEVRAEMDAEKEARKAG